MYPGVLFTSTRIGPMVRRRQVTRKIGIPVPSMCRCSLRARPKGACLVGWYPGVAFITVGMSFYPPLIKWLFMLL